MVVALLAMTLLAWSLELNVETIGTRFGSIPRGIPAPHLPLISWELVKSLVQPAVVLALLAAIESLLSAVVSDGPSTRCCARWARMSSG
jgi:SulP family sulfate permease